MAARPTRSWSKCAASSASIRASWKYKEKPDYGRCVDIVTATAQKELLGPGILAIFAPLLVGFGLGAGALGGFLGGTILTGQLMAVFMSNAGATWDNAKKKIEDGFLGGKGTDVHKAAVVGDTVGDPFKDTAGPALNPMIKVMNLVGILAAPFRRGDRRGHGRTCPDRGAVGRAAEHRGRPLQEGLDCRRDGRGSHDQGRRLERGLALDSLQRRGRAHARGPAVRFVRRGGEAEK